jgi:hypothetical protein
MFARERNRDAMYRKRAAKFVVNVTGHGKNEKALREGRAFSKR